MSDGRNWSRTRHAISAFATLVALGLVPGLAAPAAADMPTYPPSGGDGAREPAVIVGGGFPCRRLKVLDSRGRTVATGADPGRVVGGSLCPWGRSLIESVVVDQDGFEAASSLAVRDLGSMAVARTLDPSLLDPGGGLIGIRCLDEEASEIAWLTERSIGVFGEAPRVVAEGRWRLGVLGPAHAIVVPLAAGADDSGKGADAIYEVHGVSLTDGADRLLYRLPRVGEALWDVHSIEVGPSGERVAIVDWVTEPVHVHTVRVFDLTTHDLVFQRAFPAHDGVTRAWWVDDGTLVVAFLGDDTSQHEPWGTVLTLDATTGATLTEARGLRVWPEVVADGVFIGHPIPTITDRRLAAASLNVDAQAIVASFETVSLKGVHGPFPAPVSVIGTLTAFDGRALVASLATAPPVEEPLPLWLLAGAGVAAMVVALALLALRRRRGRDATSGA